MMFSYELQKKPVLIQGISLSLWGYCADLLWIALPLGLLIESRYWINRRWKLDKTDFYRLLDLTSLIFIGLAVLLIVTSDRREFIVRLIFWLPLIFYPLILVYAFSTTSRMSLDVLFYSLRKQKSPVRQSWDQDYIFIGICLIAVSVTAEARNNEDWFFFVTVAIIASCLLILKSSRHSISVFALCILLITFLGYTTQTGLRMSHSWIKEKSAQLIASWIRNRADPFKNSTSIGRIGEIQLSDSILFRISLEKNERRGMYLQEAVYDLPSGTDWLTMNALQETVPPHDEFIWQFSTNAEVSEKHSATVYLEFDLKKDLIPVPYNIVELSEFPADEIKRNSYGALLASGIFPTDYYYMKYSDGQNINSPAMPYDLYFPEEYEHIFSQSEEIVKLASEKSALDPNIVVNQVYSFFSSYSYSTFQPDVDRQDPLEYFLNQSRSGHCEFFASTTVLLLRYLGIPSRYVTGYSVQEYDSELEMFVVRKRHAHAWAIAWIDDQWRIIDTTPPSWSDFQNNRSFYGSIEDSFSRQYFLIQRWMEKQKLENYQMLLVAVGGLLTLLLLWRLSRASQVTIDTGKSRLDNNTHIELPFNRLEKELSRHGIKRMPGELVTHWIGRMKLEELLPLTEIHYKWRFDPSHISEVEKKQISETIDEWLSKKMDSYLANQSETEDHPTR